MLSLDLWSLVICYPDYRDLLTVRRLSRAHNRLVCAEFTRRGLYQLADLRFLASPLRFISNMGLGAPVFVDDFYIVMGDIGTSQVWVYSWDSRLLAATTARGLGTFCGVAGRLLNICDHYIEDILDRKFVITSKYNLFPIYWGGDKLVVFAEDLAGRQQIVTFNCQTGARLFRFRHFVTDICGKSLIDSYSLTVVDATTGLRKKLAEESAKVFNEFTVVRNVIWHWPTETTRALNETGFIYLSYGDRCLVAFRDAALFVYREKGALQIKPRVTVFGMQSALPLGEQERATVVTNIHGSLYLIDFHSLSVTPLSISGRYYLNIGRRKAFNYDSMVIQDLV